MSSDALPRIAGLQEILDRCQRLIRVYTALRGVAESLCVLIACVLFGCLLDYLIGLPGAVRLVGLAATVVLTVGVAWKRLIRPLSGETPAEELGAAVDLRFPELHESIATLISVRSPTATSSEAGSVLMRHHLEQYVQSQMGNILPSEVVQGRPTVKRWGLASISVLAILIPLLLWPSGSQLLLQRFVLPFANLATPSNLYFDVPNGNRTVAVNSDVEFIAIPRWRTISSGKVPNGVAVEIQVAGGIIDDLPMEYSDTSSQFTAVLADIRKSLRYRVRGGGATTEWFNLAVAEPPRVLTAVLKETPPTYSGRPIEMFDGVVGDIPVFERSTIEILLTFSKPVRNAKMDWSTWKPIPVAEESIAGAVDGKPPEAEGVLSVDGTAARFQFDAAGSGQFEFHVEDALGLTNLNEPTRKLIVTTDTPPKLVVSGIHDGLEVRPNDVLPLNCTITDDIGVGALELHMQTNADVIRIEPAVGFDRGVLKVAHDFQINLKALHVKNGDTLKIKVKAADERPIPGPHVVWQGPWTIYIADNAEAIGQKSLREEDQKLIESLRGLEEQLQQDAKKAGELKDALTNESNDEVQQSVRDLSEKEQTQGRKLQTLADQTAAHPLMKRQAEKLTKLAQQVRQDVPKKLDSAATAERESATQKIQESVTDLTRIREELHNTTDEIEKAAQLEQELAELNRLALDAQQLAKDSHELQQQRKDRQPEEGQSKEDLQKELNEQQQQLHQEQQSLTADLGSLLQRRQELLQAAREAQLDRAAKIADQTQQLAQQQQQLAEGVAEEAAGEAAGEKNEPNSKGTDGKPYNPDVGEKLLEDLAKMTEAARETSGSVQTDSKSEDGAKQQSKLAADRADEALRHARAGQFSRAAERMQEAANASGDAADQMNNDAQQDRREQLQQQQESFHRMSEIVRQLQDNDAAQVAVQQATQGKVAKAAKQLPTPLEELAERLNIPELGLQNQAGQALEAANAAREGAQSGEAASEYLYASELQQAGHQAQEAADRLKNAAELAQQAAAGHREPNALIPAEVGDSVSEALHSLKQAAATIDQEAAQRAAAEQSGDGKSDAEGQPGAEGQSGTEEQSNEGLTGQQGDTEDTGGKPGDGDSGQAQPGQGQPGEGQPPGQSNEGKSGQGQQPSSAQELANAADSLQAAARGALPNQFTPGQLSSDPESAAGEPRAEGKVSEFDGRNPNATRRKGNRREWGGLNDDLDDDVSDVGKELLDNEYSELIRRYRRDLARSGQKSESKPEVEK